MESEHTEVMAPIRTFVDAFNRVDIEGAAEACVARTIVIDDIPPFEWQGERAATRWFADMAAFGNRFGMSEPVVELRPVRQVVVEGSRGYVVVPIRVQWLEAGRRPTRDGWMTFTLAQASAGWRIASLTWTWDQP